MSKKVFVVILGLSVMVTYGAAFLDDIINKSKNPTGLPFGFASFNFLGGSTDMTMLTIDIAFWFVVLLVIWKVLQQVMGK